MKNDRLFIYCAGGLGRDVLRLARQVNQREKKWETILFVDDGGKEDLVNGAPVLTFEQYLQQRQEEDRFVIANGEPVYRRKIDQKLMQHGCRLTTLVYPDVYVDEYDVLEEGTVVTQGNLFGGGGVTLGRCSYINSSCNLGHNLKIGDYTVVSSGCLIAGDVIIGSGTFIGSGAIIRNGVVIGKNCIIGMGSVIMRDVPDGMVTCAVPSRIIRENKDGLVFQ